MANLFDDFQSNFFSQLQTSKVNVLSYEFELRKRSLTLACTELPSIFLCVEHSCFKQGVYYLLLHNIQPSLFYYLCSGGLGLQSKP